LQDILGSITSTYEDKKELSIVNHKADTHRNGKIVRSVRRYFTDLHAVFLYRRTLAGKNRQTYLKELFGFFGAMHTFFQHFLNNETFFSLALSGEKQFVSL